MYIDDLRELTAWFHALDHINYERWIPVHMRDTVARLKTHSEIGREFRAGNFTIQKTNRPFSAINQAHKQNNDTIKEDRDVVGLTDSPSESWLDPRLSGSSNSSMMKLTQKTESKNKAA